MVPIKEDINLIKVKNKSNTAAAMVPVNVFNNVC